MLMRPQAAKPDPAYWGRVPVWPPIEGNVAVPVYYDSDDEQNHANRLPNDNFKECTVRALLHLINKIT